MLYTNATKLKCGDEVQLKQTGEFRFVVEVEVLPVCCEPSFRGGYNPRGGVNVLLDNGKWYNHLEIQ